jgi:erythromycin esterase
MTYRRAIFLLLTLSSCVTKDYYELENLERIPLPIEVKEARVIGLGEATHGTLEFGIIKSSIIKDLIKNYRFNLIAIEADQSDVKPINIWLNGGEGNIYELTKGLKYWTFNNSAFINLLIWIREYNSQNESPINIYGIDMQFVQESIHEPFEYLKSYLPKGSVEYHKLKELDTISLNRLGNEFYNTTIEEYQEIDKSINFAQLTIENHLKEKIISDSLAFWLQFSLTNAKNAIEMYKNDVHYYGTSSYINVRDLSMAKNSASIIEKIADSKMILWAHNYHVKKKDDLMGGHLKEMFGDKYMNIGMTSRKGYLRAYPHDDPNGDLSNFKFNLNSEKTIEYKIWRSSLPIRFLMSTKMLANFIESKDEMFMLDVGAVFDSEIIDNNYASTIIHKEYDYIIYLDSTNTLTNNQK